VMMLQHHLAAQRMFHDRHDDSQPARTVR
jgi:hypothetical protein